MPAVTVLSLPFGNVNALPQLVALTSVPIASTWFRLPKTLAATVPKPRVSSWPPANTVRGVGTPPRELALPKRLPARLKAPSLASTPLVAPSTVSKASSALPMLTAMLTKSRGRAPAKATTFVPRRAGLEAEAPTAKFKMPSVTASVPAAARVGEGAEATRARSYVGAGANGGGEEPTGLRRAGAQHQREVTEGAVKQPSPMLMPLIPMHVALAFGTPPSDAAANPDTNPDTAAPRSRPLASLSFEISPRLPMGVPPSSRNVVDKTVTVFLRVRSGQISKIASAQVFREGHRP